MIHYYVRFADCQIFFFIAIIRFYYTVKSLCQGGHDLFSTFKCQFNQIIKKHISLLIQVYRVDLPQSNIPQIGKNIITACLILCRSSFCWPKAWNPQDTRGCAAVSCSKTLAADPLSPVSCEVGPPWIALVCPTHPINARLDWDVKNMKAR